MKKNNPIKEWYNKNIGLYSSFYIAKKELDLFTKLVSKDSLILDIGSGKGQDTEYLSKKGYRVVGIDFSKEMIDYSLDNRKNGIFLNIDFFSVHNFFKDHCFGGLWAASTVLTHIDKRNIDIFFKEVKKLLLSDGILGVVVRKDKFTGNSGVIFNNFSEEEIVSFFIKNGFEIIKLRERKTEKSTWIFVLAKIA